MPTHTCVEDLRQQYLRRVPRMFVDYAESGSYQEETVKANRRDFEAIKFRQRILTNVSKRSTATTLLGEPVSLPLAIAPVGLLGMQHADGEIHAARAANAMGIPFCLSTMSVASIEDVAAETGKPFWFQLYVMRDRAFITKLIARAAAAKCSALVLTVDLQVLGQRHRDVKNGLSVPPRMTIPNILNIATKPRWVKEILSTKRRSFGNIVGHVSGVADTSSLGAWTNDQFDPTLNWSDVKWIRDQWKGKLILKGIMDVDDAEKAVNAGADAIVVSNHGGRQLDGAPSSIAALPRIADAVGTRTEVLIDGGITSGQNLMRALALGARGAMIGKAMVYGLGAAGEDGVRQVIGYIQKELDITMALTGVNKVSEIDRRVLADWASNRGPA
jgi:L-lactate dehydrogenase (cytochrome)